MLSEIEALERLLQQPSTRSNLDLLDRLTYPSFIEISQSGAVFTKSALLETLPAEGEIPKIFSQDFALLEVESNVVLLTYKSAHLDQNKKPSKHTLRSSLWRRDESVGWQIIFHQGTPTEAFPIKEL